MMIFNTKRILFLAMAVFVCVAARPEVAASEDDTLRITKATPTPIEETKAKLSPFSPKPLFVSIHCAFFYQNALEYREGVYLSACMSTPEL